MTRIPRGWSWAVLVLTGALVFAGVAVAKHGGGSTQAVSATFAATTVVHRATKICTGTDGTYELTHARYTGTATGSDDRLSGGLELHVRSVYNQTENLGWVDARVKLRDAASGRVKAHGRLDAVNVNGQLEGLLTGHVRGDDRGKLLANVSAGYSSAGGFSDGQLGAGNAANTALLHSGRCGSVESIETFKDRTAKREHAKAKKRR
jgi:hypothetical protein